MSDDEATATPSCSAHSATPRVRIVNLVATSDEPVCACELYEPLGLAQPTVSHHLKKLVDAGLLEREQRGKWAYFALKRDAVEKLAAVADLKGCAADDHDHCRGPAGGGSATLCRVRPRGDRRSDG